ncbi:hypothetical protein BC830DRAFT_194910 [Chytriomyces sp. MP71]|nr:hypothetical protein BC830DRAFT_194910 [Chytriomyces sp. MP71]
MDRTVASPAFELLLTVASMSAGCYLPYERNPVMTIANIVNTSDEDQVAAPSRQASLCMASSKKRRFHIPTSASTLCYNKHLHYVPSSQSSVAGIRTPVTTAPSSPVCSPIPEVEQLGPPTSRRRFVCDICEKDGFMKVFHKKHHLLSHKVTHSTEYSFVCQLPGCSSKFRRNQDLLRHLRKVRHRNFRQLHRHHILKSVGTSKQNSSSLHNLFTHAQN